LISGRHGYLFGGSCALYVPELIEAMYLMITEVMPPFLIAQVVTVTLLYLIAPVVSAIERNWSPPSRSSDFSVE
jgi:hypothetical protein